VITGNQKYTSFLDPVINYVSLIIPINWNKTTTFASWISRFFVQKTKNNYFSENAGPQNDHNIACPKNDLTTVFVAPLWKENQFVKKEFGQTLTKHYYYPEAFVVNAHYCA